MYRFMDKEEIEIRQISNLKMLHLYKLGGNDAMAVYYGDNKQINLSAMDKHYNLLMERVLTLYSQCEDKNSIIVEDSAKKLIEEALARDNNHTNYYNTVGVRYKDKECLDIPKFASDGVMKESLIPMLKYYIKQFYYLFGVEVDFETETRGWHRNSVLKIRKGKDIFVLPVRMDFYEATSCIIRVGNFLQDMNPLEIQVTYSDNKLWIVFESRGVSLFGENRVEVNGDRVTSVTSININGQMVYFMEEDVPQVKQLSTSVNITNMLDIDVDLCKFYQLPWGGFIAYKLTKNVSETIIRTDVDVAYIEEMNTKVTVRQYSYALVENKRDGLKLRTDGAVIRKLYYGHKHREIETLFLPAGCHSGWDYKEYLENKYFYEKLEEAK